MIRTIGFVRSIPKFVALQAIASYRLFVSPYLVSSCCFVPSCSEYSRQALDKYGALKGGWLTLARLARCNVFSKPGYDPLI